MGSYLVTGGTGSFGQAAVEELLGRGAERVVVFSRDEQKQYRMAQRISDPRLRYFIGDVRDRDRLRMALRGVDTVIHAAAMKHVPIAEYNPFEAIKTNVGGAENLVMAAMEEGVSFVLALSTDKAVNPINLYGATKLCSDKCFIASDQLSLTRFSVVRYGNVLGSNGSVVPLFQRMLREGKRELPITHLEMTRFWITLPQAVGFVLDRLDDMEGGEIFVPKIPSMGVADMARALDPWVELLEVGIRPGEKLHETLVPLDERVVEHEDRYVISSAGTPCREEFRSDTAPRLGAGEFLALLD